MSQLYEYFCLQLYIYGFDSELWLLRWAKISQILALQKIHSYVTMNCTTTIFIPKIAKNLNFKVVKVADNFRLSHLGNLMPKLMIIVFFSWFVTYFPANHVTDNSVLHCANTAGWAEFTLQKSASYLQNFNHNEPSKLAFQKTGVKWKSTFEQP